MMPIPFVKLSIFNDRLRLYQHPALVFISTIIFLLVIVGCKKECDEPSTPPQYDEYYVKYEVNSSTIYLGGELNFTFRDENGTNTTLIVNQRTRHETIIGPVPRGFNANMYVSARGNTHNKLTLQLAIYTSKNGSPFALKAIDDSNMNRDNASLDYTINY